MVPEIEKQKPVLHCTHKDAVLTVFRPVAGVYVSVAKGHVVEAMAKDFITLLEAEMKLGISNMSFFHDWWELTSYDQSARHRLTEWRQAAPKGTTKDSNVLVRSKIVAMGVAASSIVLRMIGVDMRAYSDRAEFERALRATVRERSTR